MPNMSEIYPRLAVVDFANPTEKNKFTCDEESIKARNSWYKNRNVALKCLIKPWHCKIVVIENMKYYL